MNKDQLIALLTGLAKVIGGILAARGLTNAATVINTPDMIQSVAGIIITLLSFYAGHKYNATDPNVAMPATPSDQPKPKPAGLGDVPGSLRLAPIFIGLAIAIFGCSQSRAADTNSTPAGGVVTVLTATQNYTNDVIIPYFKHDFNTKKNGWGVAGLYSVKDYFYTGLRYDCINGYQNSAGVQAQLQTTVQIFNWLTATPFYETSVGLGSSSLYASTGPGLDISLWKAGFKISGHEVDLSFGLIGDYEHVVQNGNVGNDKNSNQANIGLRLHLSF